MYLTGKWKGYYRFGEGFQPPEFGKKVEFEITFDMTGSEFRGVCIEEQNEYAVNDNSIVQGFVEDNFISFLKTYENIPAERNSNLSHSTVDEKHEVKYFGFYSEEFDSFFGTWEIYIDFVLDEEVVSDSLKGIWELFRKND